MASTDFKNLLPAKERLALSRRALVRELNGDHAPPETGAPLPAANGYDDGDELEYAHRDAPASRASGLGNRALWTSVGRSMIERWWRRHPAHAVGQLARPVIERYARKQPAKLMAIAAGTGAVLVLVKPWRLLSVSVVLAALLKTSDVADLVNTLMQQKNSSPPRKDMP